MGYRDKLPPKPLVQFYAAAPVHILSAVDSVDMLTSENANPSGTLYVGTEHPDAGSPDASINIGEYFDSYESGNFQELISRSFLISIYAEWEKVRRPEIAKEFGVQLNDVKCDLMDDVRRIRNFLLHKRWNGRPFKVLSWTVDPAVFQITFGMFRELIDKIKKMEVRLPHHSPRD